MTSSSKAVAAFGLMILLCMGVFSFRSTVREQEDREWVTHTHLVVEKLQSVLIDITQAEAGQRGFILTGQQKYLEPYRAGLSQVHQDIKEVRDLTSDNPAQQDAVRRLESLIAERITALADRLQIFEQRGPMAGTEAIASGNKGGEWMDQIRALINEMRSTEQQLLNRRIATATASTRRMKLVLVLGNAFAVLFLLIAGAVIHREMSRRTQAEQQLRSTNEHLERRTAELSDTNAELESFSYSVAHDLRAPLRQIAGYSSLLTQDHAPQLEAEARRCLAKVEEGAGKMGRLIDDLLSLAKIGRQEPLLHATPLDPLLRNVVEDLASEYTGRHIEWQISSLFNAECDPGLMKQVFVNLLSNAVKYTRKREHAVIQVGQTNRNGSRVIFVRDNGAGFEMRYAGKLFGVFQRLHKTGEFEGTGVGLAIVQRIIRKHGGRIWAEAELERGATFFFTLGSHAGTTNKKPELPDEKGVINVTRS